MIPRGILLLYIFYFILSFRPAHAQQIDIERIEAMPALPAPYEMRDWKLVTLRYDSLVFDLSASGDYLPLIWKDGNGINYPQHDRFGLDSYVGTHATNQAEAINVLPAVVSATLAGIDKSDQNGFNWVEMCEEFFNRREEENVYLNNFSTSSGNDWWYDTMPNVFFYQLYYHYPDEGDFHWQFEMVARRWLEAVKAMGGNDTPWEKSYMNHRAWKLSTMTPNDDGVKEPEAAGAIGWLLYMAYTQTGNDSFRIGSEWSLEFLDTWPTNPSYELQLPYGAYIAARMNAEIGTTYDVEKLVNWCFTPDGNVRNWGMTLGNWGGYDCYGLIGEAVNEGYAFTMNGFEQLGALAPMVRYDDRFARAIGKWALHLANASRLFYSRYLPDYNQDSESWAQSYDQHSAIAYEALREKEPLSGTSPFATGDAIKGGWAATNLALYGSSHVGIMGAIIDTTDVEKILKLDLLKTDYFHQPAYPSYLLYNPYANDTTVTLNLPAGTYDVYEAVNNEFVLNSVSGSALLTIPADAAVVVVLTPQGGSVSYELDRMLVDGVTVDFRNGQVVDNYPPRIKSLAASVYRIAKGDSLPVYCTAEDRDGDVVDYQWQADGGVINGSGAKVLWQAPAQPGNYTISCLLGDGRGGTASDSILVEVLDNQPPVINTIEITPQETDEQGTVTAYCQADDADGDSLDFSWSARGGYFTGSGQSVQWQAPSQAGYYYLSCKVSDPKGAQDIDSAGVAVGRLVLSLPFAGNTLDTSGFHNDGVVFGAQPADDRFGSGQSAYQFDGTDDYIRIKNHPSLNFENEITVAFWIKVDEHFNRESYPISHGNWENRWKISLTNEHIRWTVKTTAGIKDLDSNQKIELGRYYFVACTYNGNRFVIYIDGRIDAESTHAGTILPTSFDLTIGQVLPDNSNYNFKGVLDDVLLYNKALNDEEVETLYRETTALEHQSSHQLPLTTALMANYPNPFNPGTAIRYRLAQTNQVDISIYDINGRLVKQLFKGQQRQGYHTLYWQAANAASGVYFVVLRSGKEIYVQKCMKMK